MLLFFLIEYHVLVLQGRLGRFSRSWWIRWRFGKEGESVEMDQESQDKVVIRNWEPRNIQH